MAALRTYPPEVQSSGGLVQQGGGGRGLRRRSLGQEPEDDEVELDDVDDEADEVLDDVPEPEVPEPDDEEVDDVSDFLAALSLAPLVEAPDERESVR